MKYTQKLLKTIPYIIIAILVGVTVVYAAPGSKLTPPASVANTMYSLTDIWNLASGTTATEGTGTIDATPGTVSETGKTLTQVYSALSTEIAKLTPSVLVSGNTIFGVIGEATSGPATLIWQTDPALTLCWSHNQYEIDNGCTVGSGFIDASIAQDGSLPLGAVEYCQYLNANGTTLAQTSQNIWHLPTIQEYSSITDYTRFNSATAVTGFEEGSGYWSSTQHAESPNFAWYWGTYYGVTNVDDKSIQYSVRCAH